MVSSCKGSQTVAIPVMQINICVAWGLLAILRYVQVPITLNRILFPEEVHHGNIPCAWYSRFTKSLKSTKGFLINCRTTLVPIPYDMLRVQASSALATPILIRFSVDPTWVIPSRWQGIAPPHLTQIWRQDPTPIIPWSYTNCGCVISVWCEHLPVVLRHSCTDAPTPSMPGISWGSSSTICITPQTCIHLWSIKKD